MASIRPLERTLAENIDWNRASNQLPGEVSHCFDPSPECQSYRDCLGLCGPRQSRIALQTHPSLSSRLRDHLCCDRRLAGVVDQRAPSLGTDFGSHQLATRQDPLNILVLGIVYKGVAKPVL